MAEMYPWGAQAPVQRVAKLEAQLRANEKKRSEVVEAHRKRIAELDEADRQVKADLRAATIIVDKERHEATVAAASKVLDRVLSGSGTDISEALRTGDFEKMMARLLEQAAAAADPEKAKEPKEVKEPTRKGGAKQASGGSEAPPKPAAEAEGSSQSGGGEGAEAPESV